LLSVDLYHSLITNFFFFVKYLNGYSKALKLSCYWVHYVLLVALFGNTFVRGKWHRRSRTLRTHLPMTSCFHSKKFSFPSFSSVFVFFFSQISKFSTTIILYFFFLLAFHFRQPTFLTIISAIEALQYIQQRDYSGHYRNYRTIAFKRITCFYWTIWDVNDKKCEKKCS
jgi:small-conductance mechanosensitive channel